MSEQEHIFIKKKDVKVFNAGRKQGALEYKKGLRHILNYGIWKELQKDNSELFDGVTSARCSYTDLSDFIKKEMRKFEKELEEGEVKKQ